MLHTGAVSGVREVLPKAPQRTTGFSTTCEVAPILSQRTQNSSHNHRGTTTHPNRIELQGTKQRLQIPSRPFKCTVLLSSRLGRLSLALTIILIE